MIRMMGLVSLKPVGDTPAVPGSHQIGEEKWIQQAIEKPGALHKQLGVPEDEKIPAEKLKKAAKKGGKLGKRARLAMTLRKLKEARRRKVYDQPGREDSDINNNGVVDLEDKYLKAKRDLEKKYRKAEKAGKPTLGEKLDPVGHEDADVDNDGDVDASDKYLKHRRDVISKAKETMKETFALNELNPDNPEVIDDHEGSMARAQLMTLHKQSGELFNMIGDGEELEGWVQSKLTKAADYINAVYSNMQYEKNKDATLGNGDGVSADRVPPGTMQESSVEEVAPEGWEKTVKAMKKHKEIDNPWALAYYMKKKGYKSHKES